MQRFCCGLASGFQKDDVLAQQKRKPLHLTEEAFGFVVALYCGKLCA